MPIYTSPDANIPKVLEDYPTTLMDMVSSSMGYAVSENITAMASRWAQRKTVSMVARDANERFVSIDEANEIGKEYGLEPFRRPVSEFELELLTDQAAAQNLRLSRMAAYKGAGATPIRIATGFLAGFVDPTEVLVSFIPISPMLKVGKTASSLAKGAANARRLGRAAEGAVEGAFGAAVTEPARYMFASDEQMDYDMMDSLMNVTFGAGLGSALHVGIGKLQDFVDASTKRGEAIRAGEQFADVEAEISRLQKANENASVPERIAAAAPETHPNALRATIAQMDNGHRPMVAEEVLALDPAAQTPHTPRLDSTRPNEDVLASAQRVQGHETTRPASLTAEPQASVQATESLAGTQEQIDFDNPESISAETDSTLRTMEDATARALQDNPDLAEALGISVEISAEGGKPKLKFPEIEAADAEAAVTQKNIKQALNDVADCLIGF